MFWTIAKFEAWYQLRSPLLWLWLLASTDFTASIYVFEPMRLGEGSSIVATSANSFFSVFAGIALTLMIPMTGILGPAIVRDLQLGSGELLKATPITRSGYVLGRFFGVFSVFALIYALHIPVIWLACHVPGLPTDKFTDFEVVALLQPAAVMASTLFATAGLLFAIGTITRSGLVSYVLVALLIAAWVFAMSKIALGGFEELRNAIDWTGVSSVYLSNETRSIHERNTQLLTLNYDFFVNRAVWVGVGIAGIALAWLLQGARGGLWGNRRADSASGLLTPEAGQLKKFTTPLDARSVRTQLLARLAMDLKRILISPAYAVLIIGGMFLVWLVANNAGQLDDRALEPVTRLIIEDLMLPTAIIVLIVAGVFSSELVWGDTDRKIHELVDVTPCANWLNVAPKVLVIIVASVIFAIASAGIGMMAQAIKGYALFEVSKFASWFIWPMVIFSSQIAILAITCHCVMPNKLLGWGLFLAITAGIDIAAEVGGFDHVLLAYGFGADVPLSDFNGQAHFWVNGLWLDLHWTLVAGALFCLSILMWRRGTEQRLKPRLAQLPTSFKSSTGIAMATFASLSLVSSGLILYNNPFVTQHAQNQARANEELALAPLENISGPTVVALKIDVDIRPKKHIATARGVMTIENRTSAPLSRMIFNSSQVTLQSASMPGATRGQPIGNYGVEFWSFAQPMQPGEKRDLSFETTINANTIAASQPITSVVSNGTFIDSRQLVPILRVARDTWITDLDDRKKFNLPKKRPIAAAMMNENKYTPGSGWIDAQISIETDEGQIPIAPGVLVKETKQNGRVSRVYRPPTKINNMFSLHSANYLVKRDTVILPEGPVALEIYYLPGFTRNLTQMMGAMKSSLTSLSGRLGTYPFQVLRIVQAPGYGKEGYAAQALAGLVPFYEDGGWLQKGLGIGFNSLSKTIAHETAHMWWAHQVAPSNQPGALVLTESLAELSAWIVGSEQELQSGEFTYDQGGYETINQYEIGRGKESVGEPTLALMENEKYLAYYKGPLALQSVRDQMGADKFDAVLKRFVARYAFSDKPFPNIQDLLSELRREAGPELAPLFSQLFEDRVRWQSNISKFSASGSPRSGWTINVTAAAWTEHLSPLGEVERSQGIPKAKIRFGIVSNCNQSQIDALPPREESDEELILDTDCGAWSQTEEFRSDFTPNQMAYVFKSNLLARANAVGLGKFFLGEFPHGNRTLLPTYVPHEDFLPPRPTP